MRYICGAKYLIDKMVAQSLHRTAPALFSSIGRKLFRYPLPGYSAESSPGRIRLSSTLAIPNEKDSEGKSSVSGYVATVFGATGFLGRYVVQQLANEGSQVFVPYRGSVDLTRHLQAMGHFGQVVPVKLDVRNDDSVKAAMAESNVVINLIGRDYESHNFNFHELNVQIPGRISRLAKEHGGVGRYIQVSALGASQNNPAPQYQTKAAGEEITLKYFPEATILRPAHMVGKEDRLLNTWAGFAKKMPTVPIIGSGSTRFQPVHVTDVAAAVVAVLKDDASSIGKTFELAGPDIFTLNELVALVYGGIREEPRTFHIPFSVAKMISTPEDIFKSIPDPTPKVVLFSRNSLKSLRAHYVVSDDALTFQDLGIKPQKLEGAAIEHLHQYRTGGPSVGATAGDQKHENHGVGS